MEEARVASVISSREVTFTALSEEGRPDVFASGEGTRVRCNSPCPRLRQAPFHDDDGLYPVDFRNLAKEPAPIPDPFEIKGNDLRFRHRGQGIRGSLCCPG